MFWHKSLAFDQSFIWHCSVLTFGAYLNFWLRYAHFSLIFRPFFIFMSFPVVIFVFAFFHQNFQSLGRLQKSVSYERLIQCRTLMPKHLFALGVEKSPKTTWREKIQMAAIFHLILNLNLFYWRKKCIFFSKYSGAVLQKRYQKRNKYWP